MTGGWEGDLWSGECWKRVLREREVFIFPSWQWECRVEVAPLLLRWRKVSRSRDSWALLSMGGGRSLLHYFTTSAILADLF